MRQHENVTTTEDIANPTRAAVDEPRTETDPIDSDRIDDDRMDADRDDERMYTDRTDGDIDSDGVQSDRIASDRADAEDRTYDEDSNPRVEGHGADDERDDRITAVDETARPADTTLTERSDDQRRSPDAAADVLFDEADATRFRARWSEVQTGFVDDPKRAVQDADVLVAELMQSVASAFSERKHALEHQWQQGTSVETEDLRLALRGYRSFLDQLLAR
jgi:hypothetical protein